ncbi:bifunctional riboflavin kinase/FAD synthetase [Neobacillus sp. SM06]
MSTIVEIKRLEYPPEIKKNDLPPLVLALGYFDGVHLGHQEVIRKAKDIAVQKGFKSAVMTFDPHPSVVLGKAEQHVQFITPIRDKIRLIEQLEIDFLFIVDFTEAFANLLPQEFVDQYIIGLNAKHAVAGFDFTYGRMGQGTMETLPFHSRNEFTFSVVPKFESGGKKISSTWIRTYLKEGKTDQLPLLLGRYYTTKGTVVHGDKRGRTIGFPTANIELLDDYILPPVGVYAVRLKIDGEWYRGVCNIGFKPTFYRELSPKPSIEVHLFDFQADIYGKQVEIEWHNYLRKEQKFSGIEELVAQIERDKQAAIDYFTSGF